MMSPSPHAETISAIFIVILISLHNQTNDCTFF
jgi:hypothetical protein